MSTLIMRLPFRILNTLQLVLLVGTLTATVCLGADSAPDNAIPAAAPRLVINAANVKEPLSENIYSQFIEHLGRCIYGGIWAEMLEDRKFYFPITAKYEPYRSLRDSPYPVVGASPWQIMGVESSVSMSTNQPFVGRHSPRIEVDGGLR